MIAITADLGGTRIKIGLVQEGKIIASTKIIANAESTIEDGLERITNVVRDLLAQHSIARNELSGIGLSFPSIVDAQQNRVLSEYVKYTNANRFDFKAWAGEIWDLPIALENDARAALLGEWQAGAGRGFSSIVLLTLGTGVGSAVMMDGKLLRGVNHVAGNLGGHMSVNVHGKLCNCGFFGCLETEASTWVLPRKAISHPLFAGSRLAAIKNLEFNDLFEEAENGDVAAQQILDDCLKAWGVGAVNMVHAYDPEVIIVGGGIMKRKDKILPALQRMVDQYSWLAPGTTKIIAAEQVEFAGLLGMEYLVSRVNIGVH